MLLGIELCGVRQGQLCMVVAQQGKARLFVGECQFHDLAVSLTIMFNRLSPRGYLKCKMYVVCHHCTQKLKVSIVAGTGTVNDALLQ